ncbi:MAG: hypothetical protein LBQ83_08080 [Candidatus Margulisbacteria bacterium]|jgi:hypothetical protein|nr:hypothetical protein [Candidatus Margulisiibacteriota bacterium]
MDLQLNFLNQSKKPYTPAPAPAPAQEAGDAETPAPRRETGAPPRPAPSPAGGEQSAWANLETTSRADLKIDYRDISLDNLLDSNSIFKFPPSSAGESTVNPLNLPGPGYTSAFFQEFNFQQIPALLDNFGLEQTTANTDFLQNILQINPNRQAVYALLDNLDLLHKMGFQTPEQVVELYQTVNKTGLDPAKLFSPYTLNTLSKYKLTDPQVLSSIPSIYLWEINSFTSRRTFDTFARSLADTRDKIQGYAFQSSAGDRKTAENELLTRMIKIELKYGYSFADQLQYIEDKMNSAEQQGSRLDIQDVLDNLAHIPAELMEHYFDSLLGGAKTIIELLSPEDQARYHEKMRGIDPAIAQVFQREMEDYFVLKYSKCVTPNAENLKEMADLFLAVSLDVPADIIKNIDLNQPDLYIENVVNQRLNQLGQASFTDFIKNYMLKNLKEDSVQDHLQKDYQRFAEVQDLIRKNTGLLQEFAVPGLTPARRREIIEKIQENDALIEQIIASRAESRDIQGLQDDRRAFEESLRQQVEAGVISAYEMQNTLNRVDKIITAVLLRGSPEIQIYLNQQTAGGAASSAAAAADSAKSLLGRLTSLSVEITGLLQNRQNQELKTEKLAENRRELRALHIPYSVLKIIAKTLGVRASDLDPAVLTNLAAELKHGGALRLPRNSGR